MFRCFQPKTFCIVRGQLSYAFYSSSISCFENSLLASFKWIVYNQTNIFINYNQTSTVKYKFHSCEIFLYSLIKYSFIYLIPVVHSLFRKFLSWYLLNESFSIKSNWWFFFILIPSCHTSSRFTIFCTNTYWT